MLLLRAALLLLASALAFAPGHARAQISVSEMTVDIGPNQPLHDLVVGNPSDQTAYVEVEVIQINDPGGPNQTFVKGTNPGETGLLTTPNRLILKAGERAVVRIAPVKRDPDRDRVYWVRVKPVVGQLEAQQSVIRVLFGYDVLVIVRPPDPKPSFTVKRDGRTITATNTGNTMVELGYGQQCDADGTNCVSAPGKRLYAGLTWSAELPRDAPVVYTVTEGGQSFKQQY